MMMNKITIIVWAYILYLIFLFNVDKFMSGQQNDSGLQNDSDDSFGSAGPQISEGGLLGSSPGRAECFRLCMCKICTCTVFQSVPRHGVYSATDGSMHFKLYDTIIPLKFHDKCSASTSVFCRHISKMCINQYFFHNTYFYS